MQRGRSGESIRAVRERVRSERHPDRTAGIMGRIEQRGGFAGECRHKSAQHRDEYQWQSDAISVRDFAKNQKSKSPLIAVISCVESAMMEAPTAINYFGRTRLEDRPVTNIITIDTTPPGDRTRLAMSLCSRSSPAPAAAETAS